jgi:hypothetical protein
MGTWTKIAIIVVMIVWVFALWSVVWDLTGLAQPKHMRIWGRIVLTVGLLVWVATLWGVVWS